MSGFYANELLLKLLQRNDPHPDCSTPTRPCSRRLRDDRDARTGRCGMFEKRLLRRARLCH